MKRTTLTAIVAASAATVALTGCGQAGQGTTNADGKVELTMWTHSAGNPGELAVYDQIISDYNASQDAY
jgi:multiple sugar transport system substrate-binding protein